MEGGAAEGANCEAAAAAAMRPVKVIRDTKIVFFSLMTATSRFFPFSTEGTPHSQRVRQQKLVLFSIFLP